MLIEDAHRAAELVKQQQRDGADGVQFLAAVAAEAAAGRKMEVRGAPDVLARAEDFLRQAKGRDEGARRVVAATVNGLVWPASQPLMPVHEHASLAPLFAGEPGGLHGGEVRGGWV
jgi:hypothetical protein